MRAEEPDALLEPGELRVSIGAQFLIMLRSLSPQREIPFGDSVLFEF